MINSSALHNQIIRFLSAALISTTLLTCFPAANSALTVSASAAATTAHKVPQQLETFTKQTIEDLAQHIPFNSWQDADVVYTPLGPGTHSWLVTLKDDKKPLGYIIITSDDHGGYILSEYGIGSELPYSLAPLKNTLASTVILQENMQKKQDKSPTLPKGSNIKALYSSVAPYWKITLKDKKPIYVHAVTYEIIPDPPSTKAPLAPMKDNALSLNLTSGKNTWSSGTVITTKADQDPYQNLMWLSKKALPIRTEKDLVSHLPAESQTSLVYTADKQNAAYGAPFHVTGWQRWTHRDKPNAEVIYVTVPQRNTDLIRFLPANHLIGPGKFREK